MKKSQLIGWGVLIAVIVLWVRFFWFTEVFRTHSGNESNRASLLRVYDAIQLGDSASDVLEKYWQHRSHELELRADDPAHWFIRMPSEFGAADWRLRLEFIDRKVVAVQLRTTDGPAPRDAPRDKTR